MIIKTALPFLATLCLYGSVAGAAPILNPSFEDMSDWTVLSPGAMGADFISSPFAGLPTHLASAGRAYSGSGSEIFAGTFGEWSQIVDFTGIGSITFDAATMTLIQLPFYEESSSLHSFLSAQVLIGGTEVWAVGGGGTFLDQVVDTSSFSGPQSLTFRLAALSDSNGENVPGISSSWFLFDNLRQSDAALAAVPEPATLVLLGSGLVVARFRLRKRRLK